MKRAVSLTSALAALALLAAVSATPAGASFGLKELDVRFVDAAGENLSQAGAHPYAMKVDLAVNTKTDPSLKPDPLVGQQIPDEEVKDLLIGQIPGLAGNPTAVPRCSTLDFLESHGGGNACPAESAVGSITVLVGTVETVPVYNLEPPPGVAAKLGFTVLGVPVTIELGVKPTPPYNILATVSSISQVLPFYSSKLTIFGNPGKKPFLTVPRACSGPLETVFEAFSWQGSSFTEALATHDEAGAPLGFTGCEKLGFSPQAKAQPTSDHAESPSGLDFELDVEDEGLQNPAGIANSDIKKATVTLPEGMTLNPSVAEGLAVCSKAGYEAESLQSEPGEGCPQASKVGTVQAETPILEGRVLKGELFVARQDDPATAQPGAENPFDSLIALYMVVREPQLGLLFKLAGKVTPNPRTGQIETTFGEAGQELPQYPLGHVRIHLREGGRSPLITPPSCGTFKTEATFAPWADPASPLVTSSSFQIAHGVGEAPCPPPGAPPFAPGFDAGTLNNAAGSHAPFFMRLTRRDGDQDLTKFSATLPPGLVAKLAGTTFCPDSAIAAAKAKRGREELASPSCPAASQIGTVLAGAGVGSQLTYVPGKVYLSGPYNGAPLSVIGIVPAVAGPFDVGTVAVRQALQVNPRSGIVTVDGAASDPIPHILAGIPLRVRDIRVSVDKPNFTLNPTSCSRLAIGAGLWGGGADPFSTADDSPLARSVPFQAANCASLGFAPKLALTLKGGTKRGSHPALTGTYTPRAGDANLSGLVLRLPHSAFLDQAHIRTICTRVQFAAKACPEGAVYGHATAYTPILDQPLEGPVYLRSSDHNLPDFVAALHGLVDVEAVARIDSAQGGIRASFSEVPDAPLSKVVVQMQGAKKGLIVNSTDLCAQRHRADAQMSGQNGAQLDSKPTVAAAGCGKQRGQKRHHRRAAR